MHIATNLRCGGIFSDKCSPDSDSEISLKIGKYLMKLRRTKQRVSVFLDHPVIVSVVPLTIYEEDAILSKSLNNNPFRSL